jgi:hypothetical protein
MITRYDAAVPGEFISSELDPKSSAPGHLQDVKPADTLFEK